MSEKPNPSLDCASLVRFSALPLYHGGELQSCLAVIRSSSLLQTPPPSPMYQPTTSPRHHHHPSLRTIKKIKICLHSSHPCFAWPSHQPLSGFALQERERKKEWNLSLQKATREIGWREGEIQEKMAGRPVEISVEVIKHRLTE